jgi:hypothetical protein
MLLQRFIGDRERDYRTRDGADMGHESENVAVNQAHCSVLSATDPRRARHDRVEDSLKVGRRAGDHPKNVARRRLPHK